MHTHHEIRDATQCPQGGNWYTCAETHQMHAYAGCCLVDACNQGCPKDKDRTPPRSNGTTSSEASTPTSDTPTSPGTLSVHVETIASVSAGHTVIVTFVTEHSPPTLEPTFGSVPSDKHKSSRGHVGAIVGGIVGGAALLAAIVLLLLLLRRRRRTKEERRATLPPTYPVIRGGGDMSEQFAGATPISSAGTKNIAGDSADASLESVPQLDSTAILPPNEIASDALGIIPELPANEMDPFETPRTSEISEAPQEGNMNTGRGYRDANNHVMSWANLNSMGNRTPTSRLSQPHAVPEGGVWGNMSPT